MLHGSVLLLKENLAGLLLYVIGAPVSGRGHAVLRIFKLARTPFHIDANMGKLPGVRRSSW
jgi:hypothetical protein